MFAGVDLVNTIYEEYELSDIVLDDFIEHYKLESEVVQFLDADAIVNKFIKKISSIHIWWSYRKN